MKTARLNSRQRRAGPKPIPEPLKLDFGCGPNPREGFTGVDRIKFSERQLVLNVVEPIYAKLPPGFEAVADCFERKRIGFKTWPWKDNSVEEANASHFLEHLDALERIHFLNELWRVLKPAGKCQVITPWWASGRAYGDPTHKFPVVSGFAWQYVNRDWRLGCERPCPVCAQTPQNGQPCQACGGKRVVTLPANAPHTDAKYWPEGFKCDFDVVWGWSLHPQIATRNQEYQQHALQFWIEAGQDCISNLTAKK